MKVVVLAGGISTERDVSLSSGRMIYQALKEKGHQAILLDVYLGYEWAEKEAEDAKFYCVGHSVVRYYLNGYPMGNLEGHKARTIGVDLIATFLPDDVVTQKNSKHPLRKLDLP